MLAQRRYEEVRPTVRKYKRRKKISIVRSLLSNPMACVVIAAAVFCMLISTYVSVYAGYTEKGRSRAALLSNLNDVKKDNEKLKLSLEQLRQPERIEEFAVASGMKQCQQTAYLERMDRPRVAQNTVPADIR